MIFHKDKTRNEDQRFALGENPIQFVNTFKYLGTILNENLTNKVDFLRAEKCHLKQFFTSYSIAILMKI